MTTSTKVQVNDIHTLFPGGSNQSAEGGPKTYRRTFVDLRVSPMTYHQGERAGQPVLNEDGTQAMGFTFYFAAGEPESDGLPKIMDTGLGGIRAKNGTLNWLTAPGQFILRMEEITGFQAKGGEGDSLEEAIASAARDAFAGMQISFIADANYVPVSGSYTGKSPYKNANGTPKVFYVPTTYEGRVDKETWQALLAKLEDQLSSVTQG